MTKEELLDKLDGNNCRSFATALGAVWGITPQK